MTKRMLIGILVMAVFAASAAKQKQEYVEKRVKADSISSGENDMQWSTFPSNSLIKAFAVAGNDLWMAADEGVTMINMGGKKMTMQNFQKLGALASSSVTSMAADGGLVWFGTSGGVALRSGGAFKTFTTAEGLADNAITAIAAGGGRAWAGTANGVSEYQSGKWTTFHTKDGLAGEKIRDILIDNQGRVWLATDKGVSCFDNGSWSTPASGMSSTDAKALAFDPRTGIIWAAVGESDVNSYDGKSWHVYLTIQPGITCIMADTQSRIWFGSASGLMKFNGDDWISDPGKLGVTVAQVSRMYRDAQGNLWYGTERGVMKLQNPYPF